MKTELINALNELGLTVSEVWTLESDDGTHKGIKIYCEFEDPSVSRIRELMSPRHELNPFYLSRAEETLEEADGARALQHALNAHIAVQFQGSGQDVAPGAWYYETPFIELKSDAGDVIYFELTAHAGLNV